MEAVGFPASIRGTPLLHPPKRAEDEEAIADRRT